MADGRFPALAARLTAVRLEAGLTQAACAKACGVSVQVWSNWEHGWRAPRSAPELGQICDLL